MKKRKGIIPAFLSCAWLAAAAVGAFVIFAVTRYLPILLFTALTALTAGVNLALLVTGFETGRITEPSADGKNGFRKVLAVTLRVLAGCVNFLAGLYDRIKTAAAVVLTVLVAVGTQIFFWLVMPLATSVYTVTYLTPVILALIFVSFIIFEKWCAHAINGEDRYSSAVLRNLETSFITARFALLLTVAAVVVKLLGFFEAQTWLVWAYAAIFCYETLFVLLSETVCLIKREFAEAPDAAIMIPLATSKRDYSVLSYLEKNTGITMRSLWSMKLIKQLLPYTVIAVVLLFWLGTGIVQIESYQNGAVYRFGKLVPEPLGPGLHFTLPWPMDRVETYDVGSVKRLTVGYISTEDTDNIWTSSHGSNEYKLLLGGGNELVSINLRIEYKINDLTKYLGSSSSPEKLLEAKAYELVTEKTISTDLNSLMSVDRSKFAETFKGELTDKISDCNVGLDIVSVVLESIHPPVEIASVYQEIISAGIDADRYILEAEGEAAVKLAEAEQSSASTVNSARADSYSKTASATSGVAEFMACVEADAAYPSSYRSYKYLSAVKKSYAGARLIIVGDGIDPSNIYYGSLTPSK